jgi:hypothetical protein
VRSLRAYLGRAVGDATAGGRGWIGDAVLAADLSQALGLVVDTEEGPQRFMPWLAVLLVDDELAASPRPPMLGEVELAHYRESGVCLTRLTGQRVAVRGGRPSLLTDVLVGPEGQIEALELTDGELTRVVPPAALTVHRLPPDAPTLAVDLVPTLLSASSGRGADSPEPTDAYV